MSATFRTGRSSFDPRHNTRGYTAMQRKLELVLALKIQRTSLIRKLGHADLTGAEFKVLLRLLADSEKYSSGQSEIAEDLGMVLKTVQRAWKSLILKEYITVIVLGRTSRKTILAVNVETIMDLGVPAIILPLDVPGE